MNTDLTRLLGIEHPILLAPMAGVSGGKLAAAVSEAGGLGIIGGGYGEREWVEREFDNAGDSRVGIGLITWRLKQQPGILDLVIARKPAAIMLSFGNIGDFAPTILDNGIRLIAQVQTLRQAIDAAAAGAEIIVAQGSEAGGHAGERATLPLVPAVADAISDRPIVAAGGIADGRGLAAALMLGASGILMGSRFYASDESLASDKARQQALSACGDDTVQGAVFDILRDIDWPSAYKLRTLRNRMTDHFHADTAALDKDIEQQRKLFFEAVDNADTEIAPVVIGEAVDLIRDQVPAAEIVANTVKQASELLNNAARY